MKKKQPKVCSECRQPESKELRITTVILPPSWPKKVDVCEPCLRRAIDNDIAKNKTKKESVE